MVGSIPGRGPPRSPPASSLIASGCPPPPCWRPVGMQRASAPQFSTGRQRGGHVASTQNWRCSRRRSCSSLSPRLHSRFGRHHQSFPIASPLALVLQLPRFGRCCSLPGSPRLQVRMVPPSRRERPARFQGPPPAGVKSRAVSRVVQSKL